MKVKTKGSLLKPKMYAGTEVPKTMLDLVNDLAKFCYRHQVVFDADGLRLRRVLPNGKYGEAIDFDLNPAFPPKGSKVNVAIAVVILKCQGEVVGGDVIREEIAKLVAAGKKVSVPRAQRDDLDEEEDLDDDHEPEEEEDEE